MYILAWVAKIASHSTGGPRNLQASKKETRQNETGRKETKQEKRENWVNSFQCYIKVMNILLVCQTLMDIVLLSQFALSTGMTSNFKALSVAWELQPTYS